MTVKLVSYYGPMFRADDGAPWTPDQSQVTVRRIDTDMAVAVVRSDDSGRITVRVAPGVTIETIKSDDVLRDAIEHAGRSDR